MIAENEDGKVDRVKVLDFANTALDLVAAAAPMMGKAGPFVTVGCSVLQTCIGINTAEDKKKEAEEAEKAAKEGLANQTALRVK